MRAVGQLQPAIEQSPEDTGALLRQLTELLAAESARLEHAYDAGFAAGQAHERSLAANRPRRRTAGHQPPIMQLVK
jgi:hypothetical protein